MAGSVDTRNQAWANDKSRFGLKMLQKMGWNEGKGLGREENGRINPLRAKKNFEKEGLGVSVVKNNEWDAPAQMAQGLNSVLAKLCSNHSNVGKTTADKGGNVANGTVGFYARRAAQKNVKGYSTHALREIFGEVAGQSNEDNEKKVEKKDEEKVSLSHVEDDTKGKHGRGEKRKKKTSEKLGVASKIRKPHKSDKKKRKTKKDKRR